MKDFDVIKLLKALKIMLNFWARAMLQKHQKKKESEDQ